MTNPQAAALSVHPERIRAAYGAPFSDATVERLLGCARLQMRLRHHLGLQQLGADESSPERDAIEANPLRAARRAGAFLHAQAVRNVLAGPEVLALVDQIGTDAHRFALRHAENAPLIPHDGELATAVERDGLATLGIWLADQPPAYRHRVLMRLPPGTGAESGPFDETIAPRAHAIIALVAGSGSDHDGGDHG